MILAVEHSMKSVEGLSLLGVLCLSFPASHHSEHSAPVEGRSLGTIRDSLPSGINYAISRVQLVQKIDLHYIMGINGPLHIVD